MVSPAWCVQFFYKYDPETGTFNYSNHNGTIDLKQKTINGVQCSVTFPNDIVEFSPKQGLNTESRLTVTTTGRFSFGSGVVEEKEVVLTSSKGTQTYSGGSDYLKFTSFNMPDEYWPDVTVECSCGANCLHCCICGNNKRACDGTSARVTGCPCHNPCTCFGCPHCCTCDEKSNKPCDGTDGVGGCDCHSDVCTCGHPCPHCCTCGKNKTACDGTNGAGGCACHTNGSFCTCGACCMCKCMAEGCQNWNTETQPHCARHCNHNCTHDPDKGILCGVHNPDVSYQHCECHHETHDGDCCEHHKKNYVAPPDVPDIGAFNDPGKISKHTLPKLPLPDLPSAPGMPFKPTPGGFGRSTSGPSDEDPKTPWRYFERTEDDWPEFNWEKMFDELGDKLKEKIPLDWVKQFTNPQRGNIDLSWTFRFEWYGNTYGPLKIDIREHLERCKAYPIVNIVRLVILAFVGITFIMAVLNLFHGLK